MKLHHRATACHLSYGITQCYLPPDTSERRVSTLSYAPTPSMTGHRSRTCSVLSTGDVLGSAALAAAALLPDVAAAAALATKEVAVYRVMMLGGPGVGKTALTQQFVTSEYIAAQNTSFGR